VRLFAGAKAVPKPVGSALLRVEQYSHTEFYWLLKLVVPLPTTVVRWRDHLVHVTA
jgi:hypothetical protein